uniref:PNT domain-containing protein n=1 Tax=Timema douglasi TaxID=61478 RepID=A0A7R8VDF7_TIMDO|nr:unnamed protein product [Timema douglasi]
MILRNSYHLNPRLWSETHVAHWLYWAIREFSLEGVPLNQFHMRGKDICAMGKEAFLARAPPFMGDILWEHLEILQKATSLPGLCAVGALRLATLVSGAENDVTSPPTPSRDNMWGHRLVEQGQGAQTWGVLCCDLDCQPLPVYLSGTSVNLYCSPGRSSQARSRQSTSPRARGRRCATLSALVNRYASHCPLELFAVLSRRCVDTGGEGSLPVGPSGRMCVRSGLCVGVSRAMAAPSLRQQIQQLLMMCSRGNSGVEPSTGGPGLLSVGDNLCLEDHELSANILPSRRKIPLITRNLSLET